MEEWLCKWRLEASPNKCTYITFSGNGHVIAENRVEPVLFGVKLKEEKNPKLLGILFDRTLSFNKQVDVIKDRIVDRLNIIKILSHPSWHIDEKTLLGIYNALIRSIIDYSFFIVNMISATNLKRLEAAQNTALRLIFRLPFDTPSETLLKRANLCSIEERLKVLGQRYVENCIQNNNPLTLPLFKEYDRYMGFSNELKVTPLCEYRCLIRNWVGDRTGDLNEIDDNTAELDEENGIIELFR